MSQPTETGHGENWPEAISASELAYHEKLVARAREAKEAEIALRAWGKHLREKYELQAGDGVDEAGKILRQGRVATVASQGRAELAQGRD